jgi:NADH-quinone oxidoreductase subunit E
MTMQADISDLVKEYGMEKKFLVTILQKYVKKYRYLSKDAMCEIAKQMDMSPAEVYGVASFYTFLDTEVRGENIIRICKTITCDMDGKDDIIGAIENRLNIRLGETTHDRKFSLLETNCLGQCHRGPAMLINNDIYTELTPSKAIEVIESYLD